MGAGSVAGPIAPAAEVAAAAAPNVLESILRMRAVSTAEGLVPVTGPSFITFCCASGGKARSEAEARASILFSARKLFTGSDAAGASVAAGAAGGAAMTYLPVAGSMVSVGALGSLCSGGCETSNPGGIISGAEFGSDGGGGSSIPGGIIKGGEFGSEGGGGNPGVPAPSGNNGAALG